MTTLRLDPPVLPHKPGCLSEYALLRVLHGEAQGEAGERDQRHAAACADCRARTAGLATGTPPALDWQAIFATSTGAGAGTPVGTRRSALPPRRRWPTIAALSGAATAMAVMAFALFVRQADDIDIRRKGAFDWELSVLVANADGSSRRIVSGDPVHPGDRLRFEVSAPETRFVSVVSFDSTGAVTPFVPGSGAPKQVAPGHRQLLEGTVMLDGALGDEKLMLLACPQQQPLESILAAGRSKLGAVAGDLTNLHDLGLPGCEERPFWLRKVKP